jgi:uncharacterized membrane protein YbaN (DUF454 family)
MGERLQTVDEVVRRYAVRSNPLKRRIYIVLGCVFVAFAIIGIWIPGWPTISWAVPAAFCFSLSSEKLFRWSLTNRYFGSPLFEYYATGKTLPRHVKIIIMVMICLMSGSSAFGVFLVSYPADPGFGPGAIALIGLTGIWYVALRVGARDVSSKVK